MARGNITIRVLGRSYRWKIPQRYLRVSLILVSTFMLALAVLMAFGVIFVITLGVHYLMPQYSTADIFGATAIILVYIGLMALLLSNL